MQTGRINSREDLRAKSLRSPRNPVGDEELFSLMVYNTTQSSMHLHDHNAFELIYISSGKVRLTIGNQIYQIDRPTLVIISKLETHSLEVLSHPYIRYYILLSDSQLRLLIPDYIDRSLFTAHNPDFNHCLRVPSSQAERINHLFAEMYEVYKGRAENRSAYLQAVFSHVFQLMISLNPEQRRVQARQVDPRIAEIQVYLDHHFTEDISLQAIADRWFMSPNHLSQLMKKSIGYSPKQYIMQCRLAEARELLVSGDKPISEISVACGFHDQNNFIRFFRKETGLTPGQYRQRRLAGVSSDFEPSDSDSL